MFPKRLMTFGILALLLAAAILYSRAIRRAYYLDDLRYVPKENELTLITGDVESLWSAVERHFGDQIRDDEESALSEMFQAWRGVLEEQGIPVNSVEDLTGYGLDVRRGLLLTTTSPYDEQSWPLILAHVLEVATFSDSLSALLEEDLVEDPSLAAEIFAGDSLRPGEAPTVMPYFDDVMGLVVPATDPGVVLLAQLDDPLLLRRALFSQEANRAHALEMDALFDAIRRRLGRRLGSGPHVFAFWRPRAFPPLTEVAAVVSFGADEIRVEVDIEIVAGAMRAADNLFAAPPPETPWAEWLPPDTAAVVVVQDRAATDYIRFLSMSSVIRESMDGFFAGILSKLCQVSDLRRVLLAATGYRDGLPELMLAIWGHGESLERLVDTLQLDHREARDRSILKEALEAYRVAHDGRDALSVEELGAAGFLADEADSMFHRFPIDAGLAGTPNLQPADFRVPSYVQQFRGYTIRHLLPPVTTNDLRYVEEYQDEDETVLTSDRFLMASVVIGDVLWISTNARDLEELLDRTESDSNDLTSNPAFQVASTRWTGGEKIVGFIDVDRVTTLGMLSPESELEEWTKQILGVLKDHPAISVRLSPIASRNRLALALHFIHRTGMVH